MFNVYKGSSPVISPTKEGLWLEPLYIHSILTPYFNRVAVVQYKPW